MGELIEIIADGFQLTGKTVCIGIAAGPSDRTSIKGAPEKEAAGEGTERAHARAGGGSLELGAFAWRQLHMQGRRPAFAEIGRCVATHDGCSLEKAMARSIPLGISYLAAIFMSTIYGANSDRGLWRSLDHFHQPFITKAPTPRLPYVVVNHINFIIIRKLRYLSIEP
jgi:hypothetical protein